ncbi:hypothetical protein GCM10022254_66900 [Actinomadura meridiana]|uniref:Uncharacterized protein n=1 Tax=Actinomadura meridiana TaxID=559626 RepID=A0ABP8CLS1_9ACTN
MAACEPCVHNKGKETSPLDSPPELKPRLPSEIGCRIVRYEVGNDSVLALHSELTSFFIKIVRDTFIASYR